jgi:hypothetical protein
VFKWWKSLKKELTHRWLKIKIVESYQQVFASEAGKVVLADLIERYYTLHGQSIEQPHAYAYHAGQQSVVSFILATLDIHISELMVENNHRNQEASEESVEWMS